MPFSAPHSWHERVSPFLALSGSAAQGNAHGAASLRALSVEGSRAKMGPLHGILAFDAQMHSHTTVGAAQLA